MRCALCRKPAVYAPLRFCKDHFLAYYEKKVRHYFEAVHLRAPGGAKTKVLVAVSGGKDSSALADILVRLKDEFSLDLALFTIDLNIPDYSAKGVGAAQELAHKYGVPLVVEDLGDQGRTIPEFAGPGRKPCGPCGTIKRYLLNKAAVEHGYDYIATGHNLDDEFYFAMHNLTQRNVEQLRRGAKMLPPRPEQRLAGRLKPLYYLSEKENRLYCLLRGVPHDADECPFSRDNPQIAFKEGIGARLGRDEKRNLLRSLVMLQEQADETEVGEGAGRIHPCPKCGYATTSKDDCAFCKLIAQPQD